MHAFHFSTPIPFKQANSKFEKSMRFTKDDKFLKTHSCRLIGCVYATDFGTYKMCVKHLSTFSRQKQFNNLLTQVHTYEL